MLLLAATWLLGLLVPAGVLPVVGSPLTPQGSGVILGATCLLQLAFSKWLDSRYDRGLGRNLFWMIWYPMAFWVINSASTVVAYPKVLLRNRGARARWVSPDRGIRP
jgi:poly-beta-1,6-N-acetyl-D-glucosamine synthase